MPKTRHQPIKIATEQITYRGLRQIAKAAGVSRPTMSKHIDEVAHRRLDGVIIVTRSALERWLEGHDAKGVA